MSVPGSLPRWILVSALCGAPCLLGGASVARAQGEAQGEAEVDADYRLHDTVYVRGQAQPLRGTILEGAEAGASRLKIRLVNDIITEMPRDRVERIVARETPKSAYKTRSERLAKAGSAELHARLARWVHGHGLRAEAEEQLTLATQRAASPTEALPHRTFLVTLLEERLDELSADDPSRGDLQEEILGHTRAAGAEGEPVLLLARAHVLTQLGLLESALPLMAQARLILETRAAQAPPPGEGGADEGEAGEGEAGEGEGEAAPEEPPPAPRRPPVRRFGRDGERIPGPRAPDPAPNGKAAPAPPSDNSSQLLPGLGEFDRGLYRRLLSDLAALALRTDAPEQARLAYARILEIWPEDLAALVGQAQLAPWAGNVESAVAAIEPALRVHPGDARLLLARGQLRYLSGSLGEAQADLERALRGAGSEGELPRAAGTALALVHLAAGRVAVAEPLLEAADADPGYGPARLAKALSSEIQGDLPTAVVHASEAARLLTGQPGEAHYLRAFALQRAGKVEDAGRALIDALRGGYDFQLVSRARIELARAQGDEQAEARLVELLARSSAAPTPAQLAALGRVYVRQGRLVDAQLAFKRGLELAPTHTDCLRGLAYCAYTRDDRLKAHGLFKQLLEQDKDDTWTKRGLKQLEQVSLRRVWTDDFQRPDGDVLNAWTVQAPYGIGATLQGQALRFAGAQANDPRGKTLVTREIEGETVVKLELRLRVASTNQARVGIRLELRDKKIVLFRNPQDGHLYASSVSGNNRPWTDPADLGPMGSGARTIAIDIEDARTGLVGFLCEGERLGEVKLGNLSGRKAELGIYGQGAQLGDTVEFTCEQVWIYVERAAQAPKVKGPQGGGDGF